MHTVLICDGCGQECLSYWERFKWRRLVLGWPEHYDLCENCVRSVKKHLESLATPTKED